MHGPSISLNTDTEGKRGNVEEKIFSDVSAERMAAWTAAP